MKHYKQNQNILILAQNLNFFVLQVLTTVLLTESEVITGKCQAEV